jgi:hypothetical protein
MRKRLTTLFTAFAIVLIADASSLAHHANAVFDVGKRITLTGIVTEWFWANPHCLCCASR